MDCFPIKTKYFEGKVYFTPGIYENGRLSIRAIDAKCNTPAMTVTVNMPVAHLEEYHVVIKDWAENEGLLQALIGYGLVEFSGERIHTGYVNMPVVRVTERFYKVLMLAGRYAPFFFTKKKEKTPERVFSYNGTKY